jgi:hypothetical protein
MIDERRTDVDADECDADFDTKLAARIVVLEAQIADIEH